MKHWGQRLFAFISALSLVLCVAFTSLWVRSRYISDFVGSERYGVFGGIAIWDRTGFWNGRSQLALYRFIFHTTGTSDIGVVARYPTIDSRLHHHRGYHDGILDSVSGFRVYHVPLPQLPPPEIETIDVVTVPHWALVLPTAIFPAWWIVSLARRLMNRRKKAKAGHCDKCGYDLRATPNLCPECGTITPNHKHTLETAG